jgi:outer membrane protein assembly factor BamD
MNLSAKRNLPLLVLAVSLSLGASGCLFFGHKAPAPLAGVKAAPDKVLYQNAMNDLSHHRYTVGRLDLETLINTYPDSEYLAKAKLAIANSYYEQGGMDGLTQSVAQYQDFITFFPFLNEAAFAQYRVAMAHFRMMEKPDRDDTQALEAEAALQTMILKYPKSQWTKQAIQRLREVQEVLAEGKFEVASFYELRGDPGAAAARLLDLTARYPLFSEADQANYMLAQIYQRSKHNRIAARFYAKIVRDYPLSSLAPEAKKQLIALEYPVPRPDPKALARMRDEEKFARQRAGIVRHALGILRTGPDVSHAAHFGQPNLAPDTEIISARQVLDPSVIAMAVNSTPANPSTMTISGAATASNSQGSTFNTSDDAGSTTGGAGTGGVSVAGVSATSAPKSSSADAPSARDPATGSQATEKKTKSGGKKAKTRTVANETKKKKKSLLHRIVVPW